MGDRGARRAMHTFVLPVEVLVSFSDANAFSGSCSLFVVASDVHDVLSVSLSRIGSSSKYRSSSPKTLALDEALSHEAYSEEEDEQALEHAQEHKEGEGDCERVKEAEAFLLGNEDEEVVDRDWGPMRSGNATSLTIFNPQFSTPNSSERPTHARSGGRMRTSAEVGDACREAAMPAVGEVLALSSADFLVGLVWVSSRVRTVPFLVVLVWVWEEGETGPSMLGE